MGSSKITNVFEIFMGSLILNKNNNIGVIFIFNKTIKFNKKRILHLKMPNKFIIFHKIKGFTYILLFSLKNILAWGHHKF